ncbi:hypothetical protein L6R52_40875, partial [Myxococcota bacterium]|nr:hypothetical protein [Myxococcota bacterium]
LDARVRLNDELAGASGDAPAAAAPPARPAVREDPEAKARAILAELKAKKRGAAPSADASGADAAEPPPDGPAPAPKKKRTL